MPQTARSEACREILMPPGRPHERRDLFAVLDGARVRLLPGYLDERAAEYECLDTGLADPAALTRAPFLVRIAENSEPLRWILEEGWGESWGLFVLCERGTELDSLLRDLRELLVARLPDGRAVRFRFFDPRVWRPFFPTCDPEQLRRLFGRRAVAFACEDEGGKALLLDSNEAGSPKRERRELPDD